MPRHSGAGLPDEYGMAQSHSHGADMQPINHEDVRLWLRDSVKASKGRISRLIAYHDDGQMEVLEITPATKASGLRFGRRAQDEFWQRDPRGGYSRESMLAGVQAWADKHGFAFHVTRWDGKPVKASDTFWLDVGPRGGCSHEEAGWRERCGGEGGRARTERSPHADNPRVFNTPDDVGSYESWVDGTQWGWKEDGKPTGRLLTGQPVKREDLPEELYHVTTAAPPCWRAACCWASGRMQDSAAGRPMACRSQPPRLMRGSSSANSSVRSRLRAVTTLGWTPSSGTAQEDEKEAGLAPARSSQRWSLPVMAMRATSFC